jgi:tetratricopeptide (TPR) repeat protein
MRIQRFGLHALAASVVLSTAAAATRAPLLAQDARPPSTVDITANLKRPGNADWAASVQEARDRAAAENKLVYYEFSGPDCDDCIRMQSLLYPAFDFEALLLGMVPVQLEPSSEDGKKLAEIYPIREIPSVAIMTPTGRLVFLTQGFKNQRDFFTHVHKSLADYREWAKTIEAQDVPTLSAADAMRSANQLYERFDYAEARPRYKRASAAPDATPAIRDGALEGLAACELSLNQPAQARKSIEQLIATTKDPEIKERAELFRAQIPLSQKQFDEALALYKKFEKDHPHSKYLEKVRGFIARLQPSGAPK